MKKILFTLLLVFGITTLAMSAPISVQSYNSPNDVTVTNMETNQNTIVDAINRQDGSLIQASSVSAGALENNANPEERWGRSFNNWVYTGLVVPTTSVLSTTYIYEDLRLIISSIY